MTKIIEAKGLTKVYPPSTRAVDDVSFSVEEGETFGFLGPNGAGKTTTIKMLTTLTSITYGSAAVAGYDVKSNPAAVRSSIGIVPQETTLDNELKGVENLLLAARLHHLPRGMARDRARDLLQGQIKPDRTNAPPMIGRSESIGGNHLPRPSPN